MRLFLSLRIGLCSAHLSGVSSLVGRLLLGRLLQLRDNDQVTASRMYQVKLGTLAPVLATVPTPTARSNARRTQYSRTDFASLQIVANITQCVSCRTDDLLIWFLDFLSFSRCFIKQCFPVQHLQFCACTTSSCLMPVADWELIRLLLDRVPVIACTSRHSVLLN